MIKLVLALVATKNNQTNAKPEITSKMQLKSNGLNGSSYTLDHIRYLNLNCRTGQVVMTADIRNNPK